MLNPFQYFAPETIEETIAVLVKYGSKAQIIAGGLDLIPRLRTNRITAEAVISIEKLSGITAVDTGPQGLRFGSMATLYALERSAFVQEMFPILYQSIHSITSVQTKHFGTLVGNICVGTPASDLTPVLLALDATLDIAGPAGHRTDTIEDFCVDYAKTSLRPGEFVTGVNIPAPKGNSGAGFTKLIRNHADIAKLNAAASLTLNKDHCAGVRIAVGAAGPIVFRAKDAERHMEGKEITPDLIQQAAELAAAAAKPISDFRSNADYRKRMSAVLVRRVLEAAISGPQNITAW